MIQLCFIFSISISGLNKNAVISICYVNIVYQKKEIKVVFETTCTYLYIWSAHWSSRNCNRLGEYHYINPYYSDQNTYHEQYNIYKVIIYFLCSSVFWMKLVLSFLILFTRLNGVIYLFNVLIIFLYLVMIYRIEDNWQKKD